MTKSENPTKPDVIRMLLEHEGRVMLCVDATLPGVDVPRRFARDRGLRLVLNNTMPQPIHIGAFAIESELRFGGVPHNCIIPYHALWAAYNPDTGHGMSWEAAMPPRIRQEYNLAMAQVETQADGTAPAAEPAKPEEPPKLKVIEGGGEPEEKGAERSVRPFLRVVK